jgi:hypothetical protein
VELVGCPIVLGRLRGLLQVAGTSALTEKLIASKPFSLVSAVQPSGLLAAQERCAVILLPVGKCFETLMFPLVAINIK